MHCQIVKPDGTTIDFECNHTFSPEQVDWFRAARRSTSCARRSRPARPDDQRIRPSSSDHERPVRHRTAVTNRASSFGRRSGRDQQEEFEASFGSSATTPALACASSCSIPLAVWKRSWVHDQRRSPIHAVTIR
ncbi:MAG: hypothetical protein R2697_14220 [Ilumatobacteraceae bacterium]